MNRFKKTIKNNMELMDISNNAFKLSKKELELLVNESDWKILVRHAFEQILEIEDFKINKQDNFSEMALVIKGYKKIGSMWLSKKQLRLKNLELKSTLKNNGYVVDEDDIIEGKIREGDITFRSPQFIIKFLLETNDSLPFVTIDKQFLEKLNETFNLKLSKRAFLATLERMEWLIKLDTNKFRLTSDEDEVIADELYGVIKKLKLKFILPERFDDVFVHQIRKYNLLFDEIYYLLKRFNNKLYFSTGNSMFISTSSKFYNLQYVDRIKQIFKHPSVLTIDQLNFEAGVNEFATVNTDIISAYRDKFFMYDSKDESHREYLRKNLRKILKKYENKKFFVADIREDLKNSDNKLMNDLCEYKNIAKLIKSLFGDEISNLTNTAYIYKNVDNKIVDLSNWDNI